MIFCKHYEELKRMKERGSIVFLLEPMNSDIKKIMEEHEKQCIEHYNKTLGDKS